MLKVKPSLHLLDYFDDTPETTALRHAEDKKKSAELLSGVISPDRLHLEENPRNAARSHAGGMKFIRKNGDEVRFDTVLTCDSELFPLEYEFFVRPMDNLTAMRAWEETKAKAIEESLVPPKTPHLLPTYYWLQEVHHLNDSLIERQAIQSQDWESLVCFLADFEEGLTHLTILERTMVRKFGEGYTEEDTAGHLGMQTWFVREHLKSANRSLRNSMKLYTKPLKVATLAA
jgi:hypothetical protein